METLKRLWKKYEEFANTWYGRLFICFGLLSLVFRFSSWEPGYVVMSNIAVFALFALLLYGFHWFVKQIVGLIADEFKHYVQNVVREELRRSSRVY